jgi:hypothetical protein
LLLVLLRPSSPLSSLIGLSSISGSESTTSSQSTDDKVTTLLRKQKISSSSPNAPANDNDDASFNSSGDAQFLSNRAALRTALVWFTPPSDLLPSTQLGVYRALFPSHLTDPSTFLPRLRELQLTPEDLKAVDKEEGEERRWVLLMVAGGHFAGMVVGIGGKRTGKKVVKGAAGENIRILKHKTFHRYTSQFLLCHCPLLKPWQKEEDDQLIRFSCQSCLLKLEGNKEAPNPRTTRPTERPTQSELRSVVQERSCSRRRSGSYSPVGKRTSTSPSASLSEGV